MVNAASRTMARMLGNSEVAFESARSQFWIVDAHVSRISKIFSSIFGITVLARITLLRCSIKINCIFYQNKLHNPISCASVCKLNNLAMCRPSLEFFYLYY